MNDAQHGDDPHDRAGIVQYGALFLDLEGFTVMVDGQVIAVTLTEFLLLKELALNPYHVFDRETLALAVGTRGGGQDLAPPSHRAVDLHISRLRKKLSRAGYDCIKTMRFVGYRFIPLPQPSPGAALHS